MIIIFVVTILLLMPICLVLYPFLGYDTINWIPILTPLVFLAVVCLRYFVFYKKENVEEIE